MTKKRVLVADDHPIVRAGLVGIINNDPRLVVCAEADSVDTVTAFVKKERPDALLLDLLLGGKNGISLVRDLLEGQPGLRILVISIQAEQLCAQPCLEAGAAAYVSKTRPVDEILHALHAVLNMSADRPQTSGLQAARATNLSPQLTRSEREVVFLVLEGCDNQQIADRLGISVIAVKVRLHGVYRKFGVQSRAQLAALLRG